MFNLWNKLCYLDKLVSKKFCFTQISIKILETNGIVWCVCRRARATARPLQRWGRGAIPTKSNANGCFSTGVFFHVRVALAAPLTAPVRRRVLFCAYEYITSKMPSAKTQNGGQGRSAYDPVTTVKGTFSL